jgi:mono/diheme cytochrome c family protein
MTKTSPSLVGLVLALLAPTVLADSPATFIARYAQDAGVPATALSPTRGAAFYRAEHRAADGTAKSCAGCHTADPRQAGKTRVGKRIEPLAPVANPARFTDAAKVEKWFRRNCMDVLQRECSAQEKGDFIAWLNQVK